MQQLKKIKKPKISSQILYKKAWSSGMCTISEIELLVQWGVGMVKFFLKSWLIFNYFLKQKAVINPSMKMDERWNSEYLKQVIAYWLEVGAPSSGCWRIVFVAAPFSSSW